MVRLINVCIFTTGGEHVYTFYGTTGIESTQSVNYKASPSPHRLPRCVWMSWDDYSDQMGQVMFSKLPAPAAANNPCWEVAKAITGDGLLVAATSAGRCPHRTWHPSHNNSTRRNVNAFGVQSTTHCNFFFFVEKGQFKCGTTPNYQVLTHASSFCEVFHTDSLTSPQRGRCWCVKYVKLFFVQMW